jgi:hypothetical protein
MGLAERRAVKAFQDNKLPEIQTKIDEIVGKPVPMEVDWDQLADEGYGDRYESFWTQGCFTPLVNALEEIAVDDMGREALKEGLQSIRVKGEYAHSLNPSFSSGVLTLDFKLWNPPTADEQKSFQGYIVKELEKGL